MKPEWPNIIQFGISTVLKGALIATIILFALRHNWTMVFSAGVTLVVSLLPLLIERRRWLYFPIEFELLITGFVFAAMVLGEGLNFYYKFWWWDLLLHTVSGIALGFIGFLIVYLISKEKGVSITPVFFSVVSFAFALSLGAMWEIFEYSLDTIFGLSTQLGSLGDTMWDLIVDALGGILAAIVAFFYVKGEESLIVDRLVRRFVQENPRLFPKINRLLPKIFRVR